MLKGIDHIVVVVPDLDTAIANYTQLGFTVVPGGKHLSFGTHNALVGFADGAYIELIAFFQPNPTHRWSALLALGGGIVDYCMQSDDMDADIAAFRAAGIAMDDKSPLSRTRPDGYQLDWVLSLPTKTAGSTPFLIEDFTPRAERVPKQTSHPNGVTGIASLTIALDDLAPAHAFGKVAGSAGEAITRDDLNAAGVRYISGVHTFDFLTPSGAGALAARLEQRGNLIMAATLKTSGTQRGLLDPALALNAQFSLE